MERRAFISGTIAACLLPEIAIAEPVPRSFDELFAVLISKGATVDRLGAPRRTIPGRFVNEFITKAVPGWESEAKRVAWFWEQANRPNELGPLTEQHFVEVDHFSGWLGGR